MSSDGGNQNHPVVHMSDNNLSGKAESYFRNVTWGKCQRQASGLQSRRAQYPSRSVSSRQGVPYYIFDHYGPGRHAKIVSTKAAHLLKDGNTYQATSRRSPAMNRSSPK